jgi:hypothetical protein
LSRNTVDRITNGITSHQTVKNRGIRPAKLPNETLIALPPLSRRNGLNACPAVGAAITRANSRLSGLSIWEAIKTGTYPLKKSSARQRMPIGTPTYLNTLAQPGLPSSLIFRISFLKKSLGRK